MKLSVKIGYVIVLALLPFVHCRAMAGGSEPQVLQAKADNLVVRIVSARKEVKSKKAEMNEFIELGKALYLGGVQRPDEPWLKESYDVWDALLVDHPQEPLVQAYAGSVRVLQARDAFFPWSKGKLLKQGQRLLEDARSRSPGNMQVIWLQAVTAYHLPERFGQRETALKNFAKLAMTLEAFENVDTDNPAQTGVQDRQAGVMNDNLEPAMKASVWYFRGEALVRESDLTSAIAAWRRSVHADSESSAGKAAAERLASHTVE